MLGTENAKMGLADKEAKLRSVKKIWRAGLTYNRHPKTQG